MWQQQIQRNYQIKGDRTPEDYQQIYSDLIEKRKVVNKLNEKGSFEAWFWEKDKSSKRKAFYQEFVDANQKLLTDGKVRSCECTQEILQTISEWKKVIDQKYNSLTTMGISQLPSSRMKSGVYTLDKLIEKLKKVNNRTATQDEIDNVDKSLDSFSNCGPIAQYEKTGLDREIDLKHLAFTENGVIDNNINLPAKSKAPFRG